MYAWCSELPSNISTMVVYNYCFYLSEQQSYGRVQVKFKSVVLNKTRPCQLMASLFVLVNWRKHLFYCQTLSNTLRNNSVGPSEKITKTGQYFNLSSDGGGVNLVVRHAIG